MKALSTGRRAGTHPGEEEGHDDEPDDVVGEGAKGLQIDRRQVAGGTDMGKGVSAACGPTDAG